MRKIASLIAAGLVAGLVPYAMAQQAGQAEGSEPRGEWQAQLEGQGEFSDMQGDAGVVAIDGRTAVSIRMDGAQASAVHPWHIHEGSCGSGGPIVGNAASYEPLRVDSQGQAAAQATVDVGLDPQGDYYVNVHASPQDLGTIAACGELQAQQ